MMPHEFLGAGDGMLSNMNDLENSKRPALAAAYVAYPEGAMAFPEGNKQIGIIVWEQDACLRALVSEAGMLYCPRGEFDDKLIEVGAQDTQPGHVSLVSEKQPYDGTYFRVEVPENSDGVTPNTYLVWNEGKAAVHPLGFLTVKSEAS